MNNVIRKCSGECLICASEEVSVQSGRGKTIVSDERVERGVERAVMSQLSQPGIQPQTETQPTVSQMGRGKRLSVEEFERRRRVMALVLGYLAEHGITQRHMQRRLSLRLGVALGDPKWQGLRKGWCRVPEGFVQAVCSEVEKPVEVVMGEQWLREEGPHFGFEAAQYATATARRTTGEHAA